MGNISQSYNDVASDEEALALISSSINSSPFMEMNVFKPYIGNCPVCNYKGGGNIIPKYSSERTLILAKMLGYLFGMVIFEEGF